ncbi:NAD dependent epimerase/dehydratase, partial [Terfezia boudieri ATCC MYA-4762]
VLLIGGHGRTAKYITTILLSHGHTVYSLIRNTSQIPDIRKLADPFPKAELIPLVHDLNGISTHEVQEVLSHGDGAIEWVIWAAGAKGNIPRHPQDQLSVERDAAILFIRQARGERIGPRGNVKRFIFISACICRNEPAPWWSPETTEYYKRMKNETMPTYVEAKTEVDTMLVEEYRDRLNVDGDDSEEGCFSVVSIRPGELRDTPATGKCDLGKTRMAMEPLSRQDLASVVVELCEAGRRKERGGGIGCRWLDVARGGEDIKQAVERCIEGDVD